MWAQDLRYALRSLIKRPGLTLAMLLILSLGIGATTAVFSVTEAVVLRKLPYPDADRLVYFFSLYLEESADLASVSYPDYLEWKQQSKSFENIVATASWLRLNMIGGELPERVYVNFVHPDYFKLMGSQPLIGRSFLPEENQGPSGSPVAVLSHAFWKRNFGGDRNVIGTTIRLNESIIKIIGIMPPDFYDINRRTEVWLPVMSIAALMGPDYLENRSNRWVHPVGLLKPGVTKEQATAEMDEIARGIAERNPDTNRGIGVRFRPVEEIIFDFVDLKTSTLAMMAAATLLLLICSINVANLLILRSLERRRETAVRVALGSSTFRLIRQLVIESLLLAVVGGALGIWLGYLGTNALVAMSDLQLPGFATISVNGRVLTIAVLVSLLTGLFFGLLPAFGLKRAETGGLFQQVRAPGSSQRAIGRAVLIVAEVALALILLVNVGLLIRSFYVLLKDEVGISTANVLTMRMELDFTRRYQERQVRQQFIAQLVESAQQIPGVEKAGVWGPGIPGTEAHFGVDLLPEVPRGARDGVEAKYVRRHHVTPGALGDMDVRLLSGREFTSQDVYGQPRVAVVSESMAKQFWPEQDPIGKRFMPVGAAPDLVFTVVGVAADVRHGGRVWEAHQPFPRDVYLSILQSSERQMTLYLKTAQSASSLTDELRKRINLLDPTLPVFDIATLSDLRREEEVYFRFRAILAAIFALVAVALTSMGIYSVLAYAVSQRTREIGIRAALGAQKRAVLLLVVKQGLYLTMGGLAIGLLIWWGLRKLIVSLLYGITPTDPFTLVASVSLILLVALVGIYIPARRALEVDPVIALRPD